jgi:DNA repair protein RecN (Recombination protein N)
VLSVLRISGFALIDELELELGPGLTVITGETGAGKSIIVEALGLLRGGRASADLIRTGRDEARVEAIIDLPPAGLAELRVRLEAEGREGPGAGEAGLLVRRTVSRAGRGRIHLAGGLATAGDLAATVAALIDIASQHDQQSLTDADRQLAILDAFAENDKLRAEMAAAYATLSAATAELASFNADARTRAEREDLLKFQIAELEAAAPQPGEDEQLRVDRERLKGAEKFFGAATRGEEVLYAQEGAVVGQLAAVTRELTPLSALDPTLASLVERLAAAQATVEDVARDLGRYASRVRSDPARLAEVEERLFVLTRLCRKHGGTLTEVIERSEAIARELAQLGSFEDGLNERRQAQARAATAARAAAEALTRARRKAASGLEKKVAETLRELGISQGRLPILVEPRAAAAEAAGQAAEAAGQAAGHGSEPPGQAGGSGAIGATGADRVRFLFAPNPGEEPRPLARIASGGELSRVMLAVKQALARTDRVLTYVFDEVDSGVGGAAAEIIGRKLKKIAAARQVIAITHLPQIAAFADAHIRVTKTSGQGRTRVAVEAVAGKERTREIARMLGGATPSAEATAHADEMLRRASAPVN